MAGCIVNFHGFRAGKVNSAVESCYDSSVFFCVRVMSFDIQCDEFTPSQWMRNSKKIQPTSQGTIGCTPNSVPMVCIVFSRDSWEL